MYTIDFDTAKNLEVNKTSLFTDIVIENTLGERIKLTFDNKSAELLTEKLEEKVYDDTYQDLLDKIDHLEDIIWKLKDRLEEAESHRDKLLERRVI